MLRLFGLTLFLFAFRTVAVKHNSSDHEENTSTNDHVQPAWGLEFVQSGFGLFIAFLVKEASKGKAAHIASFAHYRSLKVGAPADNKSGVSGSVWVLKFTEIEEDVTVCLRDKIFVIIVVLLVRNVHRYFLSKWLLIGQVFHVSEVKLDRCFLCFLFIFCFRVWTDVSERVSICLNNDIPVGVAHTWMPRTRANQAVRTNYHAIQCILNF